MRFLRLLLPLIPLLALTACNTTPRTMDSAKAYRAELVRVAALPTVAKGSEAERAAIARLKDFLGVMTEESVRAKTQQVYAPDAYLNDTLKTLHGAPAIEAYFLDTMKNSESVTVEFEDVVESGGFYYFRWVMDVKMKQIRKGETIRTIGITHIRFDEQGRVVLHQDYWDSTTGLFEHVPVLGSGIRAIKARL